jgi:predicted CXXCH cytochrome family protein
MREHSWCHSRRSGAPHLCAIGTQLAPAEVTTALGILRRWSRAGIAAATGVVMLALVARWATASGQYAPQQPIDFSHRVHVLDDKLDCQLCHAAARRSPFAGIAPVDRCIGCHRYVLTQHPEVTKLRRWWDAGKPIPWVKVYSLPQFVRFNHEAHTLAQVACSECHGDVGSMDRVRRVREMQMGWCVQCHRDRRAPDDCLTCHY